jgi:glucose 1-dehydrogenase
VRHQAIQNTTKHLSGRVAIITGGASGIGKAIAVRFSAEGAAIVIADLNGEKASIVKGAIDSSGGESMVVETDVAKKSNVRDLVQGSLSRFGHVDILVNSAGIGYRGAFLDISEETWDRTIEVNLKGTFLCSQEVARAMIRKKRGGTIINIASICGVVADKFSMHAPYEASKAGVILLTKVMALELASHHITVNAIGPGRIKTELIRSEPEHVSKVLEQIPLKRYGEPDEVAGTAAFLASKDASYITGHTIFVDGGWLVH